MSNAQTYQAMTAEQYIASAERLRLQALAEPSNAELFMQRATLEVQLAAVCATLEAAGLRPTEFQASE